MKRFYLLLIVLVISTQHLMAQRTITGRVLDDEGYGVPSAGVSVKGATQLGTVTDVDGNFTLSVPDEYNTLTIRAIGFNAQDVTITGTTVNVRMAREATQLTETVVTALAIRREKREIGYSATTLNDEELNSGNNNSALSAIQGKTAGVNITSTTGGPGGSTRVVMRGEKSIFGSNQALMVVDGIIINNSNRLLDAGDIREQVDFGNRGNDIPPEDIESITVLKGPAAAALYGSAGANGAIMITTKKGRGKKEGPSKTEIAYQTNYTIHSILRLPEFQNKYGQGNVNDVVNDRRENFSWGAPFDGQVRPWGQEINGQQKVKPYSALEDNVKNFFEKGRTWENNVSIGGGGEKSGYYLSLNTLNNKGIIPNNYYDKYSIRFNGNAELSNKFYSSVNLNYMNISSRVESQGQAAGSVYDNVLQTPRDIPIHELKDYKNDIFSSMIYTDSTGVDRYGYYGAYTVNPYWIADSFDNRSYTDRVLGALTLGYRPSKNWNIFNRFGGDATADRFTFKAPKFDVLPFDPFYLTLSHSLLGGYQERNVNNLSFYNDLIAQHDRQLSEDIGFHLLLGHNVTFARVNSNEAEIDPETNGLVLPGYYNLANANGPIRAANSVEMRRLVGLYSSIRVDYRKALFLEVTARNDWSSTLVRGNNSYFYPSTNLSWVFTETFKDKAFTRNAINFGKLRASYASVGNDALAYQNNDPGYIRSIVESNFGNIQFPLQLPGGSVPGYTLENGLGQPRLRPERTNSWEIGAEFSFLNGRITTDIAYYNQYTIDQIISIPLPPSSGFTSIPVNLGDISNKGVELSLRGIPVRTASGFRWELFGTYTKNVNEVTRLSQGVSQITLGGLSGMAITATVGKPFGAFFATDLATDPQGRVIVDSATGLPQLTTNTVYKGTYQPRFIASWGTTLKYKGFSLNVLFDTKQGGVFFSRTKDIMDFVGTAKETENRDDQVFANSVYQNSNGAYVTNTTQKYSPYEYFTSVIPSGRHIIDASYVKLREASLYYSLPAKWFERTSLGGLTLGVYGNNLFLWTSKENMYVDPEVNSGGSTNVQGIDFTARPSLRSYGMSLRVTF
jgi:TonB-linked SusC/RagA family outer membrane protein